jgi:hypothetical protein
MTKNEKDSLSDVKGESGTGSAGRRQDSGGTGSTL